MSDPQWWLLDDLVLARSAIDRAAERRTDQAWVEGARVDPSSRFVRVHQGTAAIDGDRLALADEFGKCLHTLQPFDHGYL